MPKLMIVIRRSSVFSTVTVQPQAVIILEASKPRRRLFDMVSDVSGTDEHNKMHTQVDRPMVVPLIQSMLIN